MSVKKEVTVDGVVYASKSDAIKAMLAAGTKKSVIAKALEIQYPFIYAVEKRVAFEASDEGKAAVDARLAKRATKIQELQDKAARKVERAAKKAEKDTAKTTVVKAKKSKKAEVAKVTKTAKKRVSKKVADAISDADERVIAEMIGENDIPEDVRAEMVQDGLLDA